MKKMHERLAEARAARFETPGDAAESLGIPYSTYAAHENGTGKFKLDSAIQYARKFKVSLDWLLTGKGKGPSPEHNLAWEIYIEMCELEVDGLEYLRGSVEFARKTGKKNVA